MYFFTEDERQKLVKGLIPQARNTKIVTELRGWNWNRPPLESMYKQKLALYEIAGKYCPTGRDVYLRRVENQSSRANFSMIEGAVLHKTIAEIMTQIKRLIYMYGVNNIREIMEELRVPPEETMSIIFKHLGQFEEKREQSLEADKGFKKKLKNFKEELERKVLELWNFEKTRIFYRIQDVLATQPYINEDSLVSLVVPVSVEQKVDGSLLGLSKYLSVDAYTFSEPIVLEIKFGKKRDFHKLNLAGYALVLESIYSFPVDLGCLIYPRYKNGRWLVEREFQIINDEIRQWFIEERDEKQRMVEEQIDPGVEEERCYQTCPYKEFCLY